MNWDKINKVHPFLIWLFWLNLGASLSFLVFLDYYWFSNFSEAALTILMGMLLFCMSSLFLPVYVVVAASAIQATFIPAIVSICLVIPLTIFLAYKFRTFWAQMLIGAGSVYLSLIIFSVMFTVAFDRAIEEQIEQQKIECVVAKSTFIEMVKTYARTGFDNYHAIAIKDGRGYLWSFRTMDFTDEWRDYSSYNCVTNKFQY